MVLHHVLTLEIAILNVIHRDLTLQIIDIWLFWVFYGLQMGPHSGPI